MSQHAQYRQINVSFHPQLISPLFPAADETCNQNKTEIIITGQRNSSVSVTALTWLGDRNGISGLP